MASINNSIDTFNRLVNTLTANCFINPLFRSAIEEWTEMSVDELEQSDFREFLIKFILEDSQDNMWRVVELEGSLVFSYNDSYFKGISYFSPDNHFAELPPFTYSSRGKFYCYTINPISGKLIRFSDYLHCYSIDVEATDYENEAKEMTLDFHCDSFDRACLLTDTHFNQNNQGWVKEYEIINVNRILSFDRNFYPLDLRSSDTEESEFLMDVVYHGISGDVCVPKSLRSNRRGKSKSSVKGVSINEGLQKVVGLLKSIDNM